MVPTWKEREKTKSDCRERSISAFELGFPSTVTTRCCRFFAPKLVGSSKKTILPIEKLSSISLLTSHLSYLLSLLLSLLLVLWWQVLEVDLPDSGNESLESGCDENYFVHELRRGGLMEGEEVEKGEKREHLFGKESDGSGERVTARPKGERVTTRKIASSDVMATSSSLLK
ncbi:hypothetical protein CR513_38888, partial [Mucuna pruriens]